MSDVMAEGAAPHRVWQRLPQGWIEFTAFGDRTPDEWLEWYLTSAEGWMPDEARSAIIDGFRSGVAAFGGSAFDFAGVMITPGDRPAVTFLCTNAVLATQGRGEASEFHRFFPLARFGQDSVAETFTAPDGRVGTVSSGVQNVGGSDVVISVGEMRLVGDAGSVMVMGVCSDPERRAELALQTAFALLTTHVLPEGVEPPDLSDAQTHSA
ncbi:hypothetical protein [Microbacterium sp. C7(2022)]|uniref:hypothetical protein n=1 Tax=Microbacterium sp. C7(2022) TaxID=2992759 RepID=UPI00237A3FBB|nr:hypothetical protein [Microbacterium sp. C7(2022)]MDE0547486.1 hypothetical protein [Microbacterium sp. C7(2022)]